MIKPTKLNKGDIIATISPSWGCAGSNRVKWQYQLGVNRLESLGLKVLAAPNSLKGTSFLASSPEARAEDLMWSFENKAVKAIIANIGGNDSINLLPFLSPRTILDNPKILCGYSDIMTLHLYCYRLGLETFYGDNLLTTIAEQQKWHPYSKHWFEKVFFNDSVIGDIYPSDDWSYSPNHHTNPTYSKEYQLNPGYCRVQGIGIVQGRLFGGHGGMSEYEENCGIKLNKSDFEEKIFFYEDIQEVCTPKYIGDFFDWMGRQGYLQVLNGIIIGKMRIKDSFALYANEIKRIVTGKYGLDKLPILYNLNFGHTSPICILPYGAKAEIDADNLKFRILESAVI